MPTISEQLLEAKRIPTHVRQRRNPMNFLTVDKKLIGDHEAKGWEVERRNKKSVRMKRAKAHDVAFEDRVWAVAAGLGFRMLNRDRKFRIQYGPTPSDSRQIDVFAADDETVLVVDCKSTEYPRASALKKDIEALQGCERGIRTAIRGEFPDHKVKFIFATNGFGLAQPDHERIESAKFVHLDEDAIEYYEDLLTHLGPAARYQFLGMLFAGQKIPGMDSAVTALRAKMGGRTYYSFSIEPERLLKIAYVLHRNKANSELMPTYQRLIKRTRLKQVREFVDAGGFFPNSLIINVDAPSRGLGFDKFAGQSGADVVAGTLKLPQQFRSAYVIDGQHRLYGYVNSKHGSSDLVPVVAFENLERAEQVRIFMQINENQKAVPKNLRNTLNADLLWDSEDMNARARALKLRIAQHLGESKRSPLYGRIIIGENKKSKTCCIAIDTISTALDRGNFIGSFTKAEMTKAGTLHRGTNEASLNEVTTLLECYFDYLREQLPDQWALANDDGGYVFINNGVESLTRLLSDVVDHLCKEEGYNPLQVQTVDLFDAAKYYLDPAVRFLEDADAATTTELRRSYGTAGRTRYWRRLQRAVQDERPEFTPDGLADFLRSEEKAFNTESFEIVRELELFFKEDIRDRLSTEFGSDWLKKGLPRKIYLEAANLATEKNLDRASGEELGAWDCLHLINYREIVSQSSELWSRVFAKRYTRPGDEHMSGGYKARSSWMVELNRIRNENDHTYSVNEEEYDFLVELKRWLLDGEVDNELPV